MLLAILPLMMDCATVAEIVVIKSAKRFIFSLSNFAQIRKQITQSISSIFYCDYVIKDLRLSKQLKTKRKSAWKVSATEQLKEEDTHRFRHGHLSVCTHPIIMLCRDSYFFMPIYHALQNVDNP